MKERTIEQKRHKVPDMVSGMFFSAALAMIFTQIAGFAANVIDGIITSRYLGPDAYSAVSLLGPFTSTLLLLVGFFSVGAQVVSSRLIGNGKKEEANRIFSFAILATLILSAIFVLGCIFCPGVLFSICGISSDENEAIYLEMMNYLHGYMYGIPAMMLIQILGPMIVIDGRKRLFSYSAFLLCVFDVVGDLLNTLVFHGGNFGMGLATSFSFMIQLLMILTHFIRKNGYFRLSLGLIPAQTIKDVSKAGSPTFVRKLVTILRDLMINRMNISVAVSTASVAARGMQNDLNTLMFCISLGIGKTLLAMTGIYYGANDKTGLKRLFRAAIITSLQIAGFVSVILFFGAGLIADLYTDEPEVYSLAVFSMRCMALSLVLDTILDAMQNYLQAIENRKLVNMLNFAERFFVPVVTAFVLSRLFGSKGIMASIAVGKVLLGIILFVLICIRCKGVPKKWEDLMFLPDEFGGAAEDNMEGQIYDLDEVITQSRETEKFCLSHGAESNYARWMSLFLEEMAGNIIKHGHPVRGRNICVDYRLFVDGDRLCLCLRDYCEAFDPTKYYELHRGERSSEHIGIRMIMGLADQINYCNTFNSNTLMLYLDKASADDRRDDIMNDFALEKRLKEKSPELHQIVTDCVTVLKRTLDSFLEWFPTFTDHSLLHSMDVLDFANHLLGKTVYELSIPECFVLVMSCYLHDIGMGINREDYEEFVQRIDTGDYLKSHPEATIPDVIRSFHNEFSGHFIRKYAELFEIPSEEMVFAIIQVSCGHRKTDLFDESEYPVLETKDGIIRTAFLSAVLRIADEIDVGADRNPEILFDTSGLTNKADIDAFGTHESIKTVEVTGDAIILAVDPIEPRFEALIEDLGKKIGQTLDLCRDVASERSDLRITQKEVKIISAS